MKNLSRQCEQFFLNKKGNRNVAAYICCPMENVCKKIFYMGIEHGECLLREQKVEKTGLPIRKLERDFPYLIGEGKGRLRIYFSLLPEYPGRSFWGRKPRMWKKKKLLELLRRTEEAGTDVLEWTEQIVCPKLAESETQLPIELWAACIYAQRPFNKICISFSEEAGEADGWQAIELIMPYLPRIRQVFYYGERNRAFEVLEACLYEEYGMIMADAWQKNEGTLWIDFAGAGHGEADESAAAGYKYLNYFEILKFLDTSVKNSYNTEVN